MKHLIILLLGIGMIIGLHLSGSNKAYADSCIKTFLPEQRQENAVCAQIWTTRCVDKIVIEGTTKTCGTNLMLNGTGAGDTGTILVEIPNTKSKSTNSLLMNQFNLRLKSFMRAQNVAGVLNSDYMSITCKAPENSPFVSVICNFKDHLGGSNQMMKIQTYNSNLANNNKILLSSLVSPKQLEQLSQNLYNYFVISLNATTLTSQDTLKNALVSDYFHYINYTLTSKNGKINTIKFYFTAKKLGLSTDSLITATVSYPQLHVLY